MDHPEQMTLELSKPVTLGSETYSVLELREPTVGEVEKAQRAQRGADGSATASDIVLVSLVSGVPKPAVEKIVYRDFRKAVEYLAVFLEGGPATGATS